MDTMPNNLDGDVTTRSGWWMNTMDGGSGWWMDTMPNNLDGDVTKSYRMNTRLCLNVFCVGWLLAVTYSLFQRIS